MPLNKKEDNKEFYDSFKRSFIDNKSKYVMMDCFIVSEQMRKTILYGLEKRLLHQVGPPEKEKLLNGDLKADLYHLTERGREYFGLK
ncbi:MAG: hypothetical protein KKE23_03990 [Nanoarchaeota archaeon]|nr:hypothetical protein [Nanoarchaeota archaeon]